MTQLFNSPALAIGTVPSAIWVATGKFQGSVKANVTIYNNNPGTGPVTLNYIGQAGTRTEIVNPNEPYYAENVAFDALQLSCTVATTIQIDISTDTRLPANFQAISSTGVTTAPQGIDTVQTYTHAGTYTFFISPPTNKRWNLWGMAIRVACYTTGQFEVTSMSIHLITNQSSFSSEGPFWATAALTDTLTPGESDEFWVVPTGVSGVGSTATNSYMDAALPFELEVEQSMSILLQFTITSVTNPSNAVLYILPLGIEEPA